MEGYSKGKVVDMNEVETKRRRRCRRRRNGWRWSATIWKDAK